MRYTEMQAERKTHTEGRVVRLFAAQEHITAKASVGVGA